MALAGTVKILLFSTFISNFYFISNILLIRALAKKILKLTRPKIYLHNARFNCMEFAQCL